MICKILWFFYCPFQNPLVGKQEQLEINNSNFGVNYPFNWINKHVKAPCLCGSDCSCWFSARRSQRCTGGGECQDWRTRASPVVCWEWGRKKSSFQALLHPSGQTIWSETKKTNTLAKFPFKASQFIQWPYVQHLRSVISGMQDKLLSTWTGKYWNLKKNACQITNFRAATKSGWFSQCIYTSWLIYLDIWTYSVILYVTLSHIQSKMNETSWYIHYRSKVCFF